jgi:hypothetical protein
VAHQYNNLDFSQLKEHFAIPDNKNLARNTRAKLFIQRCPNTNFFCSSFAIPEISIHSVTINTPANAYNSLTEPGEQYSLQPLDLTLIVDENYENYLELIRWLNYIVKNGTVEESYSNALAIIYNSELYPILSINFFSMFILSIGRLDFNVSESDIITLPVTIDFVDFEIEKISTNEKMFQERTTEDEIFISSPFNRKL